MSESLREYVSSRLDLSEVVQVTDENGNIGFAVVVDGWYTSDDAADGMLAYHRKLWRDVLKGEGMVLGERWSDNDA